MTKRCSGCKEDRPRSEFARSSSSPSGLQNYCKSCRNAAQRRYYHRNPKKAIAKSKAYKSKNADKVAEYVAKNRERLRLKCAEWRRINPEKMAAAKRRWRKSETGRAIEAAAWQRRRARLWGAFVENVDSRVVWERDKGICNICGTRADEDGWDLDHIIPISRGGKHCYDNVSVSHPRCNRKKSNSLPVDVARPLQNR